MKIGRFIRQIPYKPTGTKKYALYLVHPLARYQEVIRHGTGKCSDVVKSLAYELNRDDIDYQIIHILKDKYLLDGNGHSVVRMPLQAAPYQGIGLVDPYNGGILTSNHSLADFGDLQRPERISFHHLQSKRILAPNTYQLYLSNTSLGYTSAAEMRNYSAFIEKIYVPLGHAKLETVLYDGLSLLVGAYPQINVLSLEDTLGSQYGLYLFYRLCLWSIRICLLILLILTLNQIRLAGVRR